MLKDADGKIDLDLPVRGNVDDPEFSYGSVIWGALGNLLLKVVTSPFAALGNLLGIEASELEAVNFLAGRSDLTPPEMQRAGKLAEALALRPELQLMIAGVYDAAADGLALRTARFDGILELQITELASQQRSGSSISAAAQNGARETVQRTAGRGHGGAEAGGVATAIYLHGRS